MQKRENKRRRKKKNYAIYPRVKKSERKKKTSKRSFGVVRRTARPLSLYHRRRENIEFKEGGSLEKFGFASIRAREKDLKKKGRATATTGRKKYVVCQKDGG